MTIYRSKIIIDRIADHRDVERYLKPSTGLRYDPIGYYRLGPNYDETMQSIRDNEKEVYASPTFKELSEYDSYRAQANSEEDRKLKEVIYHAYNEFEDQDSFYELTRSLEKVMYDHSKELKSFLEDLNIDYAYNIMYEDLGLGHDYRYAEYTFDADENIINQVNDFIKDLKADYVSEIGGLEGDSYIFPYTSLKLFECFVDPTMVICRMDSKEIESDEDPLLEEYFVSVSNWEFFKHNKDYIDYKCNFGVLECYGEGFTIDYDAIEETLSEELTYDLPRSSIIEYAEKFYDGAFTGMINELASLIRFYTDNVRSVIEDNAYEIKELEHKDYYSAPEGSMTHYKIKVDINKRDDFIGRIDSMEDLLLDALENIESAKFYLDGIKLFDIGIRADSRKFMIRTLRYRAYD